MGSHHCIRDPTQVNCEEHIASRMGEWKYGLCDCINPCNLMCLYSAYCSPCAIHDMAEEYEPGSGVLNMVLGLVIPIFPLVKLRGEAREKSQIQGSVMEDCCTVFCCPGCAIFALRVAQGLCEGVTYPSLNPHISRTFL